jgi:uncharacterized Fe-S cluster-containing protein
MVTDVKETIKKLPGLNCGVCGYKTCEELAAQIAVDSTVAKRCIHLETDKFSFGKVAEKKPVIAPCAPSCPAASCAAQFETDGKLEWRDNLGREFDFYLEHFPEDAGPREIIIPHNPMITREMEIKTGDVLIGRPLGMSCGCPITHCGIAKDVDPRTGVLTWCVTGPLNPRQQGYKDLGYYIAEGYEGIVKTTRVEIKIGMRYYFQPRMCMLQWRHSGLVNYINVIDGGFQIRLEGLWIG